MDGLEARGVQRGWPSAPHCHGRLRRPGRRSFDGRRIFAADAGAPAGRGLRGMVGFVGSPDTVAAQLKAFHERAGVGVSTWPSSSRGSPMSR